MSELRVALLTAGRDRPYAFGMATALIAKGLFLDIIGGDDLDCAEWHSTPRVQFLNLRGDMREDATLLMKISRVLIYYGRLLVYASTARPKIFHILWNNKFETFDRVALTLYYKMFGKRILLTVHNVNARTRDANDTWFNRLTLKIQYSLVDHLFVHTEKMKKELGEQFAVPALKISVVPFGINNAVPNTNLTSVKARRRLGVAEKDRIILFFGHIAPYKGLEYLVDAFRTVVAKDQTSRLIIAGNLKDSKTYKTYWEFILKKIEQDGTGNRILLKTEYIPDRETELYFKAADVLVLPYRYVYQSGVLSLGYSFGLPVIATDVGSLREDIVEGKTGFVCRSENSTDLAMAIAQYFASDLYMRLSCHRPKIQEYARQRFSWDIVGKSTARVYERLLGQQSHKIGCQVVQD